MFQLEKISLQDLLVQMQKNEDLTEYVASIYDQVVQPRFYLKEVGISGKVINDWVKADIVDKTEQDGKWRQFSFNEAIWLSFIEELRFFGVPLKTIKNIKKEFYDTNLEGILASKEEIKKLNEEKEFTAILDKVYDEINNKSEHFKNPVILNYLNPFKTLLVYALIGNIEPAFIFGKSAEGFFDLKPTTKLSTAGNSKKESIEKIFSNESFAVINIKSLFSKFFETEKVNSDLNFYLGIMNKQERELIQRIRSGNYSKITITLEEEKIVLTKAMKKNDDSMIKSFARLMKKGEFKDVEFSTRDGKIIKFNEIEVIK